MAVEVNWFGHASFRIAGAGGVAYIDPWKLDIEPHDANVVIVSHSHYDHCSSLDVQKVCRSGTAVLTPVDAVATLPAAQAVSPGQRLTFGGIVVETVAAYNVREVYHPRGKNWIGVVISLDGKRIYYAGDTDLINEMGSLRDVDLALLPVGGTYTMDAAAAAKACHAIGCKLAVPYHWGDVVGSEADARQFLRELVGCEGRILQRGQSLTL